MTLTQKDQEAINHIASVSKHKHAALIAKWLITGRDVEFKNILSEWVKDKFPQWNENCEYRLVEPPKPMYRVALIGDLPKTAHDKETEKECESYPNFKRWMTEWTEYDPDQKKWPTPLVERIAAIDIQAAEWIVDHWDELLEDRYTESNLYSRYSDTLFNMFVWDESEQGRLYWKDIADKLGEEDN